MLLELYLKENNVSFQDMHYVSGIPEATLRNINKRQVTKWNIEYYDAIAKTVNKDRITVINEIELLNNDFEVKKNKEISIGAYDIGNRRYIGSKSKLMPWIKELIEKKTSGRSFFDVFAGTGVVTEYMINDYDEFFINDFLFSNNVIYNAFFGNENINVNKIKKIAEDFNKISNREYDDSYFSDNFGNKFFSVHDSIIIGEIRTCIEKNISVNKREKDILIASLLYSCDKIANTVGHYDAYRKIENIDDKFVYKLINPVNTEGKKINIYRNDANELVKNIKADIAFIDPPYNSRQYSRFYHVLETLTKWDKPDLTGVAMKPPAENISDYCKTSAPKMFYDLIHNLNVKYIVVTYNNTYTSKSKSSRNKITHDQILSSLNMVGKTEVFEKPFNFFNAGKTDLKNHKEFVFITEVKSYE